MAVENPIKTEEEKDVYIALLEHRVLGLQMESLRLAAMVAIKEADDPSEYDDLHEWAKNEAKRRLGFIRSEVTKMANRAGR